MENPRIIIIGSSSSAATAFLHLQKMLSKTREPHDLLLVTDKDFFSLNSMRSNYFVGTCAIEDISEEFRNIGYLNPSTSVVKVKDSNDINIDLKNKKVILPGGEYLYKVLVIAPENDTCEVNYPYSGDCVFTVNNIAELKALKAHIVRQLYQASIEDNEEKKKSLMSFSVLGGSEYSIELACNISDYVDDLLKRQFPEINPETKRVYLIEDGKNIDISADAYMSNDIFYSLNKKSISLKLDTKASKITNDLIELDNNKDIRSSTIVLDLKNYSSSIVNKLKISEKSTNKVLIDLYLKPKGIDGVFVIGEASKHLDIVGKLIFNTSFYKHQAIHCAKNVMLEINGNEAEAIQFDSCVTFISLGKKDSAFAFRNYKFRGLLGWFLHVCVSLSCLHGLGKKVASFNALISYMLGIGEVSFIEESQFAATKIKCSNVLTSSK